MVAAQRDAQSLKIRKISLWLQVGKEFMFGGNVIALLIYILQPLLALFTAFQAIILVLYAANSSVRIPTSVAASALAVAEALGQAGK
jgi:hypothetical protein